MIKYIRYWTYAPTLLSAINLTLIAFHTYHLDNPQLQALDTLASVIGTVIGVQMNHIFTKEVE